MRVFPMCITVVTDLFIARLVAVPFKWVQDFNHYVWLMLPCLMRLNRHNPHMYCPRLIKWLDLLNASNTFVSKFTTSWRSQMESISSDMINIRCHKSFNWAIKFGCICRKNTFLDPIKWSEHVDKSLMPLPKLWEIMLSIISFSHSLACT